jgi:predicted dienelactone hydrolase
MFFVLLLMVLFKNEVIGRQNDGKSVCCESGPYKVVSIDLLDMRDSQRNDRNVPMRIFCPEAGENFPLVIMSHGAAGTWNAMRYQAEHVASYGYVVICPEHIFSNSRTLKYYMSDEGGDKGLTEAIQTMLRDPRERLNRPKDISFVIDQAALLNKQHGILYGKINSKKIAVMGHSYGAYTTLLICGARTILDTLAVSGEIQTGLAEDLSDNRVTFGFAMSPQGPGLFFNEKSYKYVNRPLVCISGTKDNQEGVVPGVPLPAERRLSIFSFLPPGDKYFLWLENADHLSFAHNNATFFLPSRARKDVQRIVKSMMVIFCNYFLKDDKSIIQYINNDYVNSLKGRVVREIELFEK